MAVRASVSGVPKSCPIVQVSCQVAETRTHASVDMRTRAQLDMLCGFVSGLLEGGRVQAATL